MWFISLTWRAGARTEDAGIASGRAGFGGSKSRLAEFLRRNGRLDRGGL